MSDGLKQFDKEQFVNIETFRKNGVGVKTPTWFFQEEDVLYVITGANSWKVKRMRNRPEVQIVPCDYAGKLRGEWVAARAEFVTDSAEIERINRLFKKKYGLQKAFFDLFERMGRSESTTIKIQAA